MSESLFYNAIFSDGHFEKEKLGALLNKGGAAGKIYADESHPELVAKIFHNKSKSKTNRQKLEAMLQNKPNIPPIVLNDKKFVQIAWPEAVLEDDEGFCVGYLMPYINTNDAVSLDHLMQKAVRQKIGLSEKYSDRLYAAYNVASMVAALHACGHYIVDLKPANVSVYKENMIVAMFDCDGFSINGENVRYPAEFVSEEYIYPEGMNLSCEEMGEEQDKFALAVILFRLLNNGIHPFSGSPRKNNTEMLSIQERIEKYHYAYGLWPDTYQAPNPYSIHEYFDPKTLALFDRAFMKNQKRPTAREWQLHLESLFQNLKTCKKNADHIYFTPKGCGLCAMEEKFAHNLSEIKKEKESPQKIRGMEISELTTEKTLEHKKEQQKKFIKLNKLALLFIAFQFIFFVSLPFILYPFRETLSQYGYFIQVFFFLLILRVFHLLLKKAENKLPLLKNIILINMLHFYAIINIIICFFVINQLGISVFQIIK